MTGSFQDITDRGGLTGRRSKTRSSVARVTNTHSVLS